jgi:hypothetical protein
MFRVSQFAVAILAICPACETRHCWRKSDAWVIDEFADGAKPRRASQLPWRRRWAVASLSRLVARRRRWSPGSG